MTGVSPAHFTLTGIGATISWPAYFILAPMIQESSLTLAAPEMAYLSSFSAPILPSSIGDHRPVRVALVSRSLNLASAGVRAVVDESVAAGFAGGFESSANAAVAR